MPSSGSLTLLVLAGETGKWKKQVGWHAKLLICLLRFRYTTQSLSLSLRLPF